MHSALPFTISNPATNHIVGLLRAANLGEEMEPGIMRCFGHKQLTPKGELVERLMEEHFDLAYDSSGQWLSARKSIIVIIGGYKVWIPLTTLDALRGKTLTLAKYNVSIGRLPEKTRDFLVAE